MCACVRAYVRTYVRTCVCVREIREVNYLKKTLIARALRLNVSGTISFTFDAQWRRGSTSCRCVKWSQGLPVTAPRLVRRPTAPLVGPAQGVEFIFIDCPGAILTWGLGTSITYTTKLNKPHLDLIY